MCPVCLPPAYFVSLISCVPSYCLSYAWLSSFSILAWATLSALYALSKICIWDSKRISHLFPLSVLPWSEWGRCQPVHKHAQLGAGRKVGNQRVLPHPPPPGIILQWEETIIRHANKWKIQVLVSAAFLSHVVEWLRMMLQLELQRSLRRRHFH